MDKVKNAVQPHVNKLNNYLQTSNDPLVKLLTNAEQKTGVNRLHLLLGETHGSRGPRSRHPQAAAGWVLQRASACCSRGCSYPLPAGSTAVVCP